MKKLLTIALMCIIAIGLYAQPNTAVNPSPADEAEDVSITPTLTWEADPAGDPATLYKVYLGTVEDEDPDEVVYSGTELTVTLDDEPLEFNTTYYWMVVPENSDGPATACPVWSFTTRVFTAPLPAINPSPANAATIMSIVPTLSWAPDPAGDAPDTYTVHFGTVADALAEVSPAQSGTTYTPNTPLAWSTTYYWKVVPTNTAGSATTPTVWSFSTGNTSLVGPAGTENCNAPMVPFAAYSISQVIYTEAELAQAGITGNVAITHLSYQAGSNGVNFVNTGNRDWLIMMGATTRDAFAGNDYIPLTELTEVKRGTVSTTNVNGGQWLQIALDTPFEYSGSGNIVIFVNEYAAGAGNTGTDRSWYGDNSSGIARMIAANGASSYVPIGSTALSGVSNTIRPNLAIHFETPTAVPGAAVLTSPANAAIVTLSPTFTWTPASTGEPTTNYKVYLDTNQNPTTQVYSGGARTYTPATPLNNSTTYYWKVVASNSEGNAPDSEVRSFTTLGALVGPTGTEWVDMPMGPYANYSVSEVIYTQAELTGAGLSAGDAITHLYYQINHNGINLASGNNNSWLIYMGVTQKESFIGASGTTATASDLIPISEMTKVKEGVVSSTNLAAREWLRVALDTPFIYPGTGNIVIYVNEYSPGQTGTYNNYWFGATVTAVRAFQGLNETGTEPYKPIGNTEWTGGSRAQVYAGRPNLAVSYTAPFTISGTVFTNDQPLLKWIVPLLPLCIPAGIMSLLSSILAQLLAKRVNIQQHFHWVAIM